MRLTAVRTRRAARPLAVAMAALGIVGVVTTVRSRAGADVYGQHIGVPAYIHTSRQADWDELLAQDSKVVQVIVANMDNGPGTTADPAWQELITRATEQGKRVLGYVDTGYLGSEAWFNGVKGVSWTVEQWRAKVEADISRWRELYTGIGGIFFDDVTWACGPAVNGQQGDDYAQLYARLSRDAKVGHPDDLMVLNPGVNPQQCLSDAADVIVSWEGTANQYLGTPGPGEQVRPFYEVFWNPKPPADRFWHIIYDTSPEQLDAVLAKSRERGAGWVFVTDDKGDWRQSQNPFDEFPRPEYWDQVMSGVSGLRTLNVPTPGTTATTAKAPPDAADGTMPAVSSAASDDTTATTPPDAADDATSTEPAGEDTTGTVPPELDP